MPISSRCSLHSRWRSLAASVLAGLVVVAPAMLATRSASASPASYKVVANLEGFSQPFGIAVSPNGSAIWVANKGGGSVIEVSPTPTPHIVATIGGLGSPTDLVLDPTGAYLWVTDATRGVVEEISTAASPHVVASVTGFTQPGGIAYDAVTNSVWVADQATGDVAEITPGLSPSLTNIVTGFTHPAGLCVSPDGSTIWVADKGANAVSSISATTSPPAITNTITGFSGPVGITALANGHVWVSNFGGTTISEVTPGSPPTITATISGFIAPVGITHSATSNALWVAAIAQGTVLSINPTTQHIAAKVGGASEPAGIAVAPNGTIWVTNYAGTTLSEISLVATPVTTTTLPATTTTEVLPHTGSPISSASLLGGTLTLLGTLLVAARHRYVRRRLYR